MQEDTASFYPPPRQTRRGPSSLFWLVILFWLFLIAGAGVFAWSLYQVYLGDRVLAGVRSLQLDLGRASPEEAAERLSSQWQSHRITFVSGDQSWSFAPDQLGLRLDAAATVAAAQTQGRPPLTPEIVPLIAGRLAATTGFLPVALPPIDVRPVWSLDTARSVEVLRTLAAQLDIPTQNAGVAVVDGQVQVTPSVAGRAMDLSAVLAAIERQSWGDLLVAGSAAEAARFELGLVYRQPEVTDVSSIVGEVTPLLSAPIAIKLWDPVLDERTNWLADPADLGRWMTFRQKTPQEGGGLEWSLDGEKVGEFVMQQNTSFGDDRHVDPDEAVPALLEALKARSGEVRLRIRHGDRSHVVAQGETLSSIGDAYGFPYPWLMAANPELGDALIAGATIKIPSVDVLIPLPVVENKRVRISIERQRMWAYENGELLWEWPISTGMDESPTSPGIFQVQSHEEMAYAANWNLYMPWFIGIYRPVPNQEFMNGFHGFPSRDRKQILWERNLGAPITYGCILLSTDNSKKLYDWAEAGVIVEITRD